MDPNETISLSVPTVDPGAEMSAKLWRWLAPFIFVLGVIGNSLILIVKRGRTRQSGTHVLIKLLAAADLLVLIFGMLPEWLRAAQWLDLREAHPATCKFYKFFMYSFSDIAIWLITAFTVERFVAVCFPLKKNHFCRIGQVKVYCASLVVLAIVKNTHAFFTRGAEWEVEGGNKTRPPEPDEWSIHVHNLTHHESSYTFNESNRLHTQNHPVLVSNCGYTTPANAHFHFYIRPWIVFAVSNVIPLVTLIICNTSVIVTLYHRRSAQYLGTSPDDAMNQVTAMCMAVSVAFILFYLPSMILLVGKPYWQECAQYRDGYLIAKAINNQLLFINHSINFYLYMATGKKFREMVYKSLCHCEQDNKRQSSKDKSVNGNRMAGCLDSDGNNIKLLDYS